ncbi:MAG: hypothetical protein AAF677_05820 [Pseudomonadota bacterium]
MADSSDGPWDGPWDMAAAEAETRASVAALLAESGLAVGTPVTLDLRFAPGPAADRAGFVAAMRAAGYRGHAYSDGAREELEASVPAVALDADTIWAEEARAAAIALAHGYEPVGWGFEAPD